MAQMKALALALVEERANCAVLVPFGETRFFKYRWRAAAYLALQRAKGKPAFIFPESKS